jgi:hypothetical protein
MPVLRQPVPRVCDMFLNFPSIYLGGMKYNVYTAAMQVRASQSRVRQLRDAIGSFSTFYHVPTCIHTRVTCLTIESVLIRQGRIIVFLLYFSFSSADEYSMQTRP